MNDPAFTPPEGPLVAPAALVTLLVDALADAGPEGPDAARLLERAGARGAPGGPWRAGLEAWREPLRRIRLLAPGLAASAVLGRTGSAAVSSSDHDADDLALLAGPDATPTALLAHVVHALSPPDARGDTPEAAAERDPSAGVEGPGLAEALGSDPVPDPDGLRRLGDAAAAALGVEATGLRLVVVEVRDGGGGPLRLLGAAILGGRAWLLLPADDGADLHPTTPQRALGALTDLARATERAAAPAPEPDPPQQLSVVFDAPGGRAVTFGGIEGRLLLEARYYADSTLPADDDGRLVPDSPTAREILERTTRQAVVLPDDVDLEWRHNEQSSAWAAGAVADRLGHRQRTVHRPGGPAFAPTDRLPADTGFTLVLHGPPGRALEDDAARTVDVLRAVAATIDVDGARLRLDTGAVHGLHGDEPAAALAAVAPVRSDGVQSTPAQDWPEVGRHVLAELVGADDAPVAIVVARIGVADGLGLVPALIVDLDRRVPIETASAALYAALDVAGATRGWLEQDYAAVDRRRGDAGPEVTSNGRPITRRTAFHAWAADAVIAAMDPQEEWQRARGAATTRVDRVAGGELLRPA